MRFTQKIKKFVAITLAGAVVMLSANVLSVHAQSISDVSAEKPGYGITHTQTGSGVNVRKDPEMADNIIVSIPNNTSVMIVGESGNFYKVQYNTTGLYGYASKDYIDFVPSSYYLSANISLDLKKEPRDYAGNHVTMPAGTAFAYVATTYTTGGYGTWYRGVYGIAEGYTSVDNTTRHKY